MKLRYLSKKDEGQEIWSYYFEPVEAASWLAGQSIRLELPRNSWGVDERRFTIASAPHEKHIQITTWIGTSEFKQNLAQLKIGSVINGYNIEGDFVWTDDDKPKIFLAGGVGITPFRSILSQALNDNKEINVKLIYSSSNNSFLFKDEFELWQSKQEKLEIIFQSKRINIESIEFISKKMIYISGPDQMVDNLSADLLENGLPLESLRRDWFTGDVKS